MIQGNNDGDGEGSRCLSSNGSSLSLSFSCSTSISPLNEMIDVIRDEIPNVSSRGVNSNPTDERCRTFSNTHREDQRSCAIVKRKINKQRIKRNKMQRYSKQNNYSCQFCNQDFKCSMASFSKWKPKNEKVLVGGGFSKVLPKKSNVIPKKYIHRRSRFEKFTNSNRVVTLGEVQNILLAKENMFFKFVTNK